MTQHILVTGGAGYIGSHTTLLLLEAGYNMTVLDNLSNSSAEALERVAQLAGKKPAFQQIDLCDLPAVENVFASNTFDAVIHFSGLKAVGESVARPLTYYENNLIGTLNLFRAMAGARVISLEFSPSATMYGDSQILPISKSAPRSATNPFGRIKLIIEEILADLQVADPGWRFALLRYFNPVGAHPSGMIGEDPRGTANNLMPYISQVAVGKRECLAIFGGDYPTPDGTGVRDYIHVMDLAEGHLAALAYLSKMDQGGLLPVNLGTCHGVSVLEMVRVFARVSGRKIPYKITDRRSGDVASCYADVSLARSILGWLATRDFDEMCADTWRWQSMNPDGYKLATEEKKETRANLQESE